MDWKLHMLLSLVIYALIASVLSLSLEYAVIAMVLLVFGSLLPDMDHPRSVIRKAVFMFALYVFVFFVMIGTGMDFLIKLLVIGMMSILSYYLYRHVPLSHRGTRSLHLWRYVPLTGCIFTLAFVIASINISLVLFLIVGYASHLAADKVTKI